MSPEPVAIEPFAGGADLDGILEIDAVSFPQPWTRSMYERDLEHPERAFILVARTAGRRVAGYCACWAVADELHINNVAVHPSTRRRGVGRALVAAALAAAAHRGASRAWLEVRSANVAARALYARLGFVERGRRAGYYAAPPDDAIVLFVEIQGIGLNPGS